MRKALAVLMSFPLVACVVGDGTEIDDMGGGGGGGGSGSGSGSGDGGGITGMIESDTSWTGSVVISGNTTINAGVTVTVAAGTTIVVKPGVLVTVNGILDAQGTSASKITIGGEGTASFGGITVNGELKYKYVTQTGGGITTFTGAKATILDTRFSKVAGDFLMMNGGTVDMQYSAVGLEPNEQDTTHCNLHFGGAGNVIKVTHSNVSTSAYGLMFYGGMGADFTYNNWFSNGIDVDTQASSPVSGTFNSGWFEKGAPSGPGITATDLAPARLAACDGTNDATCAGPRP